MDGVCILDLLSFRRSSCIAQIKSRIVAERTLLFWRIRGDVLLLKAVTIGYGYEVPGPKYQAVITANGQVDFPIPDQSPSPQAVLKSCRCDLGFAGAGEPPTDDFPIEAVDNGADFRNVSIHPSTSDCLRSCSRQISTRVVSPFIIRRIKYTLRLAVHL
jgi:hypothetical protein